MHIRNLENEDGLVSNLSVVLEDTKFTLRWKWPQNSEMVYIFKTKAVNDIDAQDIKKSDIKLYTKAEYKEFNGYVEDIKEINQFKFIILPAVMNNGEIEVIRQLDEKNQVLVCTGKPQITYEVIEHKKLFSGNKTIKIIIYSDVSASKDVLCYVKKQGSYPSNREDGLKFDFSRDFNAGKNEFEAIEVGKNEYIRVFIKNVKDYESMYLLKQR